MSLIFGTLAAFIVTTIVTESYLFGPVRSVAHRANPHAGILFSCFLCFGTWVGIGLGFVIDGPFHPVLNGLAYHGLSYIIHQIVALIDDVRIRLQR